MDIIQNDKEKKNIRRLAIQALLEIDRHKKYANIVLPQYMIHHQLQDLDRRFLTELVYGVLRRQNYLDRIIEHFTKKKISKLSTIVLQILRLGIYQILYMDKVPVSAAVNESVKLAKKMARGMDRLVNGLLRNVDRHRDDISIDALSTSDHDRISLIYNQPLWLVDVLVEQYGMEETIELCRWFNETPLLIGRVNTLVASVDTVIAEMTEAGWKVERSANIPEALIIHSHKGLLQTAPWVENGSITFMDEASMAVAYGVNPKRGMRILDACAAPGGKTMHMAALMENTGQIIATDVHAHKVKLLQENATRLGVTIVDALEHNALHEVPEWTSSFDIVLVDAPCSGLGILQKKLDMRWRKEKDQLENLPMLQQDILHVASRYVKEGGHLVYSTCTINKKENEDVVAMFIQKHPNFVIEDVAPLLPFPSDGPMVTLLPHEYHMDGFFIARLRKEKE